MQAYQLMTPDGPDGLVINPGWSVPEPGFGEVGIRVRAASLNYRDLLIAGGRYGGGLRAGTVPLSDGAGEIVALGEGVTRFAVGDRVMGCFFPDWSSGRIAADLTMRALGGNVDGMLAEQVVLPAAGVVRIPAHLSYEEAATLPCAAVTAWNALVETGRVTAGDTVLLLGTGGVSIFALQIAKLLGARTIITSGSDEKLERARRLGADEVVNYRATADWDGVVRAMTDRRGVDLVVEVGGAGTLERSLKSVCSGGTVAMVGALAGQGQIDPRPIISRAIRLTGVFVGSRAMFEAMNRAIVQAALHPVIDRVFPFTEAKEAFRYQASGSHFGKVVVTV